MDKKKVKELIQEVIRNNVDSLEFGNDRHNAPLRKANTLLHDALIELSKSEWISVEDRLPLCDEKVFVCNKRHPNDVWKSFRLEKKGTDVISVNLNKTLDVNGFVIHKGNIHITHWRRIEKLEE